VIADREFTDAMEDRDARDRPAPNCFLRHLTEDLLGHLAIGGVLELLYAAQAVGMVANGAEEDNGSADVGRRHSLQRFVDRR
jgi:hypothetical protein